MNKLEQYLKPPSNINTDEEMYNASQERDEEINEYNQNEENSYDNGNQNQNIEKDENDLNNEELQNSKNQILKNYQNQEENNEIIQGINSLNNLKNQNIDTNHNENENQIDIEENKISNENIEQNYINPNNNRIQMKTNPDEVMNDLLFKIRKFKGNRNNQKNNVADKNELTMNNDLKILQRTIKNERLKTYKNEYIGKLNINNQIIQNNPKMKELANLIKVYNQDKNKNDNIQINFYKNNQINILKPDVFFNMGNQKKKNSEDYNFENSNNQNKHYISIIDGKAIINGQRINVNSGFQNTPQNNNLFEKKQNFYDINKYYKTRNKFLFDFDDRKGSFLENKNNLDFKLKNLKKNYRFNNIENSKNNYKFFSKNNFFTKEFYNEELSKINENLFNMSNERIKIGK